RHGIDGGGGFRFKGSVPQAEGNRAARETADADIVPYGEIDDFVLLAGASADVGEIGLRDVVVIPVLDAQGTAVGQGPRKGADFLRLELGPRSPVCAVRPAVANTRRGGPRTFRIVDQLDLMAVAGVEVPVLGIREGV